jgi:hypothetical protein
MSTVSLFVALVAAVAGGLVLAARRIATAEPTSSARAWSTAAAVVAIWIALPAILAARGALDSYAPLPTLGLAIMLLVTAGTIALAFGWFGGKLLAAAPLAAIVGFQAFRLPLELLLHRLHSQGVIPVQMTYSGMNFDIATGVSALVLALALHRRRCPTWLLMAWNLVGLALLINIVAVAVLSSPVPFRYFTDPPANLLPSTFPYVWLPTFLVQAALFGHLLVFRALRLKRRREGA